MKRTEEIPKLACPHCGGFFSRVIDTEPQADGTVQRVRRCLACQGRYVTQEAITRAVPKDTSPDTHAA